VRKRQVELEASAVGWRKERVGLQEGLALREGEVEVIKGKLRET
jgi:hypothetical protein